jgi:hypothetical protein
MRLPVLTREEVAKSLTPWQSKREEVQVPATFNIGERVRSHQGNASSHHEFGWSADSKGLFPLAWMGLANVR